MQKILLILIFLFAVRGLQAQTTIYVSPDGNDLNPGTIDRPLHSLTGARDALRRIRKVHFQKDTLRVIILAGTYYMNEPLILTPEDGGTERFPVVYRAEQGTVPVFTGGKRIKNISTGKKGYWTADIPEVREGREKFEQLFVNGYRALPARSPDTGYYTMKDVRETVLVKGKDRAPRYAVLSVSVDPEIIQPLEELSAGKQHEVVMTVFHKWDITKKHIEAVTADPEPQLFTSGGGMKPWNKWGKGQRFILENFTEALTMPGEWFLNNEGTLQYIPRPGEKDPSRAEVIVPGLSHLVIIKGNPEENRFVRNIHMEGLRFLYTAYHLPARGFEPSQAAATIDAAIQADGARDIVLKNCDIAHTGNYAVWFRNACAGCRVEHCFIHDLGAGGIRIGTMQIPKDTSLLTRYITIENSIIHSGGYIFPPAVGIWIGQSSDNTIDHNDIGDFRYTGVSVGWVWGYAYSPAKRNRITYNHIHLIGWGMLSDMGGVYTLGTSEGTVVSHNMIDHVWSYSYGGWGLYPDEGSGYIVMEDNLVYKTKTGGFHQHYGKENIIRNNIFAFASEYQLQCTRVENHRSFTFTNNIVYYNRGELLAGPWDKINVIMDHNLYWNTTGSKVDFLGKDFSMWKASGKDKYSVIADPWFRNPYAGDFHFKRRHIIRKTGFVPFDYEKAGVYGTQEWKDLARFDPAMLLSFERIMEKEEKMQK